MYCGTIKALVFLLCLLLWHSPSPGVLVVSVYCGTIKAQVFLLCQYTVAQSKPRWGHSDLLKVAVWHCKVLNPWSGCIMLHSFELLKWLYDTTKFWTLKVAAWCCMVLNSNSGRMMLQVFELLKSGCMMLQSFELLKSGCIMLQSFEILKWLYDAARFWTWQTVSLKVAVWYSKFFNLTNNSSQTLVTLRWKKLNYCKLHIYRNFTHL